MEVKRTLTGLRDSLPGRIYVFLKDEKTKAEFLADAKAEGWSFGDPGLPEVLKDDIICVNGNKQLCYVGFVGHTAFGCGGGNDPDGQFHRIDYAKYKNEDKEYIFIP
ncbi:MAG: hypothetical protein K6G90_05645 [Clostridia bacterium]|nr:hypothetical protein [Clostridia bacterium]